MPISRIALYAGKVLDLFRETHQLPDGRRADFEIIRHPGGAAVLPVLPDGRLLLIRQFRPAAGTMVTEIPAGRLEPGEDPDACVRRELEEEAGYRAERVARLGENFSAVGYCDERIHLFVATGLTPVPPRREADEYIELQPLSLAEALALLEAGEIPDAKTQLALLLYARSLGS